MPQLPLPQPTSNIKKFFLPSTASLPKDEQAWVLFDIGSNQLANLEAISDDDKNQIVSSLRITTSRIKDWNFTDSDGNTDPITFENVCRMSVDDLRYLRNIKIEVLPEALSEEKKSS